MTQKQPVYKEREVDLRATMTQLEVQESVFLPYDSRMKTSAIRMAASRMSAEGDAKYSVSEKLNGTTITRTA